MIANPSTVHFVSYNGIACYMHVALHYLNILLPHLTCAQSSPFGVGKQERRLLGFDVEI
jgi:hypothetical protein